MAVMTIGMSTGIAGQNMTAFASDQGQVEVLSVLENTQQPGAPSAESVVDDVAPVPESDEVGSVIGGHIGDTDVSVGGAGQRRGCTVVRWLGDRGDFAVRGRGR